MRCRHRTRRRARSRGGVRGRSGGVHRHRAAHAQRLGRDRARRAGSAAVGRRRDERAGAPSPSSLASPPLTSALALTLIFPLVPALTPQPWPCVSQVMGLLARPAVASKLGEVWVRPAPPHPFIRTAAPLHRCTAAPLHRCTAAPQVHHTDIGDESCVDLGSLLRAASSLNELHVSDSEVALRRCSCTAPKGCSCTSPTWR